MSRGLALVSGAGTGIGRACSLALAERGLDVLAVGRRPAPLAELVREHRRTASPAAGTIEAAPLDASLAGVLDTLLDERPGRLEVVVASAGHFVRDQVVDLSPADWDAQLSANLTSAFHTLQATTRRMLEQDPVLGSRGHVFTLNSGAGVVAFPGGSAYAAAKHGLRGLVESLRGEVAGTGIGITDLVVNACIDTPMSAGREVAKVPVASVAQVLDACLDLPRPAVLERVDLGQVHIG